MKCSTTRRDRGVAVRMAILQSSKVGLWVGPRSRQNPGIGVRAAPTLWSRFSSMTMETWSLQSLAKDYVANADLFGLLPANMSTLRGFGGAETTWPRRFFRIADAGQACGGSRRIRDAKQGVLTIRGAN